MKVGWRVLLYCIVLGVAYGALWRGLDTPEPLVLAIASDGRMEFDGQRVDRTALRLRIAEQVQREAGREIYVIVADDAPNEALVVALEQLRQAGLPPTRVVTAADARGGLPVQ